MRRPATGSTWHLPVALVVLTTIPLAAGSLRLVEVAGGPVLLPANPRLTASPLPLVLHVVAAAVFALVGAFQLFPRRCADGTHGGTAGPAGCSSARVWSSRGPGGG